MGNHTQSGGTGAYAARAKQRASTRSAGGGATGAKLPVEAKRDAPLVPIGRLRPGERVVVDPYSPPNPQFLIRVYGEHQLARSLQDYMHDQLKETARAQGIERPARSKDGVIAQIVQKATDGRYQGNLGSAKASGTKSKRGTATGAGGAKSGTATKAKAAEAARAPLVPIRGLMPGEKIKVDPFSGANVAFLMSVYGHAQLGRALQDYTHDMLKEAAGKIQARNPGTKPKNLSSKASLIDYIVEHTPAEQG